MANIRRNGQIETIIIRELGDGKYEVVNGNHRLAAFREVGLEEVQAYNLGTVTEQVAKRIAIETNETKFERDDFLLSAAINDILKDLPESDLLETLPYNEQEFHDLLTVQKYDWEDYGQGKQRKEKRLKNELNITLNPKQWEQYQKAKAEYGAEDDAEFILHAIAFLAGSSAKKKIAKPSKPSK